MTSTQLFVFGINHQTAPVTIRERVAFHAESLRLALHDLTTQHPVREAAILSTCNRTEIYCHTSEPATAVEWMAQYHHLKHPEIAPYLYQLPQEQAVKHAFRVASGLDSMVLGEPQILGQIKQAVRAAEEAGTLGMHLHKLFQRTFSVAKAVRSSTDIGASSVSMAAAAVRVAQASSAACPTGRSSITASSPTRAATAATTSPQRPSRPEAASTWRLGLGTGMKLLIGSRPPVAPLAPRCHAPAPGAAGRSRRRQRRTGR